MKNTRWLATAALLLLTGCVTAPVYVPVPNAPASNVKPLVEEIKHEKLKVDENPLENLYTRMQQDVKDLKRESVIRERLERPAPIPSPVMRPISVPPAKVVPKPSAKPVIAAVPAPVVKPVVASVPALPKLPANAVPLIPKLMAVLDSLWPDLSMRSFMGAKIEQESCISLTHSKCWATTAELKVTHPNSTQLREYGFGLGQMTTKFNKDGTEVFNVWRELTKIDSILRDKWTWENRFDADLQLRATVIKSKASYDSIRFPTANEFEKLAFGAVTYNSGSVLVDRRLCLDIKGCDGSRWFGHVELYSVKAKVAQKGYGESFFTISRTYPRNILYVRRPKYIPYMDGPKNGQAT